MSGRNSNNDEEILRNFMERIAKKVENSPALNGGWDKLVLTVQHIKEKQEETGEKVDVIHNTLYKPDEGFFARVRTIERETVDIQKQVDKHLEQVDEICQSLKQDINENKISAKEKDAVTKLHKIAGDDLEELAAIIKVRKLFEKIFWLVLAGTCTVVSKTMWDIISNNHR